MAGTKLLKYLFLLRKLNFTISNPFPSRAAFIKHLCMVVNKK